MEKKLILGLMSFLILGSMIALASANTIYQETADDISYIGNWINPENAYDGDWDTYASGSYDAYGTYIYLNYSKPEGALLSSDWEIKDHEGTTNLTIDTYCFAQDQLQLRIQRITMTGFSRISWQCYDGGEWIDLRTTSLQEGYDVAHAYEEAMIWNVEEQGNEECDYYVGQDSFDLPSITSAKVYDDSPTHKLYLACLYDLDGDVGYEEMIGTQNCQIDTRTFDPTEAGDHEYKLVIAYRERQFNFETGQFETISEGTEETLNYDFKICNIPDDEEGHAGFVNWLQNLLCTWFGWFC